MKKKILLLFIFIVTFYFMHNNVCAETDIDVNISGGSGTQSDLCSSGNDCMRHDWNFKALKVTLMKYDESNDKLVIVGNSKKVSMDSASLYYLNPKTKEWHDCKVYENPNDKSEWSYNGHLNYCWIDFFDESYLNYSRLDNILKAAGFSWPTTEIEKYYLKVEPVFKLIYLKNGSSKSTCDYYGTADEIVNNILTKNDNCNAEQFVKGNVSKWYVITNYYENFKLDEGFAQYTSKKKQSNAEDYYKNSNSSIYGKGLIKLSKHYNPTGKLTIIKTRANGEKITSDSATFQLYSNSSCTTKVPNKSCSTEEKSGSCEITGLNYGTYYLKETKAPNGYVLTSECKPVTVNSSNVEVTFVNKTQCEIDFGTNPTRLQRINLYNDKYSKYNNLLNFSIINAQDACSAATCSYDSSISCLNASLIGNGFSGENLSCYTSTVDVNGKGTAFCKETFTFTNYLGITSNSNSLGTLLSGQMILKYEEALMGKGLLTRKCYLYSNSISYETMKSKTSSVVYKNYVDSISLNQRNLIEEEEDYIKIETIEDSNSTKGYVGTITTIETEYNFESIYARKGSGKISYNLSNNTKGRYKFLGYGVVSKFIVEGIIKFPFEVNFKNNSTLDSAMDGSSLKSVCIVDTEQKLITPPDNQDDPDDSSYQFNLEFRIIDTANPFPGKNGSGRRIGSNWCDSSIDPEILMQQILSCSVVKECNLSVDDYDMNNNGELDAEDALLFKQHSCTFDNELVTEEIINSANSYGRDGNGNAVEPKYAIILDSQTIRKIRGYNSVQAYDDYTLECDENGENCKSTFLRNTNIISSENITIKST